MTELVGAKVELTGPDGQVYHFRYGATIPYAGVDYAVLLSEDEEGQILVTRMEEQEEGIAFVAAEENDVVDQVWSKYCDWCIRQAVQDLPEAEEP